MRFDLKYLAKRLYMRRDIFWKIYMSDEIQSQRSDKSIINFPVLNPEDIDYEYICSYLRDWIAKKYMDNSVIKITKIDNNEYYCESVQGALMNKVLYIFIKDYKEVFLSKLERKVIVEKEKLEFESKLSSEETDLREEVQLESNKEEQILEEESEVENKQSQTKKAKIIAKKPKTVEVVSVMKVDI